MSQSPCSTITTCVFFPSHQLFDEENPVHKSGTRYMFTTEGHVVSVDKQLREAPWREEVFPNGGPDRRPPDFKAINSSSNVGGSFQGRVAFGEEKILLI